MKISSRTCSLLALSLAAWPKLALAQPVNANAEQQSSGGLGEIVVTVQRRSESLQKVPITVTAIQGDHLNELGAGTTRDLPSVVPGLVLNQSITNATPFLRGVGQTSGAPGLEPSVAFYLDGVYFPTGGTTVFSMENVAQVAVLKGPQGTLFGRNSTGGVIQVTTKTPSATPEVVWNVGYGKYDTAQGNLYLSGPLGDTVRTSLALTGLDQSKGWGRNITTGKEVFTRRELGAHSKTVFAFGPTDVTLNLLYTKNRGDTGSTLSAAPGSRGADGILRTQGEYDALPSVDSHFEMEQGMGSLTVEHDMDWARIKAIGSYQHYRDSSVIVQNGLPFGSGRAALFSPFNSKGDTYSGELQLQSAESSSVHWVMGLYGFHDRTQSKYTLSADTTVRASQFSDQTSKSVALFGQASMEVVPATNLSLGLRYTIDEKSLAATTFRPNGSVQTTYAAVAAAGGFPTHVTWKEPTWRVALDHEFSPDAMIFASYNRGFKSGIFNLLTPNSAAADPEKLDAYEAGGKFMLLDRRLRLNASAFYYRYKGLQIRTVRADTSIALYNAANATMKGIDVDFNVAPTDRLELTGGFEVLDATYGKFQLALCTRPNPAGGNVQFTCDRTGAQITRAPKFTGSLGLIYKVPLGESGQLTFTTNDQYNSGFPWEVSGRLRQESYHNVSASVKWASANGGIWLRIWGTNLADEKIRTVVGEGAGDVISPGAPRTYGVTIGGSF